MQIVDQPFSARDQRHLAEQDHLNAPAAAATGTGRSYTVEAGEATLALEVRDSTTGAP